METLRAEARPQGVDETSLDRAPCNVSRVWGIHQAWGGAAGGGTVARPSGGSGGR